MKHRIDPKIDCVFKALLGSEENRNLLIHFLNAILTSDLSSPITEVEILNPYNDKEFLDDKLSVVDVKAKDSEGRLYQIEIQLLTYRHLPERMVYTWCDIISQQLQSGNDYSLLKPVYSIWLLAENLLPGEGEYAHEYTLSDRQGRKLGNLGGIHLLELKKFTAERIETEEQRWLQFFKEGEQLDESALPDWMNTDEMRQAMKTLKLFSEKERDYHAYQSRQNYLREQRTIQIEREEDQRAMEKMQQELERERMEKQAALRDREAALQREQSLQEENERLKALLAQSDRTS
ncbi:MAG: Rpn family recombination-promoting nuclease/putative transposase [Proteobacteria bacterium]|nr:Rpn family recombination-promoting nuclease/putative transposase [Pseudomonadota bacterium]